ncbi:MAG: hypothetical protein MUP58_00655 [Candidatus Nanohaloarchaeota archaeon QJJ-9]|nr:hypothetical protein [Candidatus Nanohaloarchaeota archaeon QJJ-9]
MKLKHYYVNLIDLPEVLPFSLTEEEIENKTDAQEESGKEVFNFVEALEGFDTIHYIGQDNVEGKFYQRFLFNGGGFLELMQKAPSAIVAHFSRKERAQEFAEELRKVIKEKCGEEKEVELLASDVEVNKEEEGSLSYEKWSKLNNVRSSITG